jgi:hypothetical protein
MMEVSSMLRKPHLAIFVVLLLIAAGSAIGGHFSQLRDLLGFYRLEGAESLAEARLDIGNAERALHHAETTIERQVTGGSRESDEGFPEISEAIFNASWNEAIFYFRQARGKILTGLDAVKQQGESPSLNESTIATARDDLDVNVSSYVDIYILIGESLGKLIDLMASGHDTQTRLQVNQVIKSINDLAVLLSA